LTVPHSPALLPAETSQQAVLTVGFDVFIHVIRLLKRNYARSASAMQ